MRDMAFAPANAAPCQTENVGDAGCRDTAADGEAGADPGDEFFVFKLSQFLDGQIFQRSAVCGSLVVGELEEVAVAENHGCWLCVCFFRGVRVWGLCGGR
jgi:hypothetical protein